MYWWITGFRLFNLSWKWTVNKEGWGTAWVSINYYPSICQIKGSAQEWWRSYGQCFPPLFQIISNKENGINVDRWDYILRDCHQLNLSFSFDYSRLLEFCRVVKVDKEEIICFHSKERHNIYDMFQFRFNLYYKACYHSVVQVVEEM